MNPSNSSNSSNPINFLTVDLEDYFQVHAFSNVIRYEDWDNYESRIEKNTHRLLDILNECIAPNNSINSTNPSNPTSVLSPNDSKFLPHTSNLAPQGLDLTPCSMPSALCRPVQATFFCLGWLAERYPHLIRKIKEDGHEIACHGYAHKLIYTQTREEFRDDIRKAKAILEDITGSEVCGYRAPSYSITKQSQWAFGVLAEEGFKYDSSIFPIHHDFYGFPQAPRFPFLISQNGNNNFEFSTLSFALQEPQSSVLSPHHSVLNSQSSVNSINLSREMRSLFHWDPTNPINSRNPSNSINLSREMRSLFHWDPTNSMNSSNPSNSPCSMPHASSIVEFPISTVRILGVNLPMGGGGYFRLSPYPLIKKGLRRINEEEEQPFIFYIHPWEIDPDQPRINSISRKSRFRHYVNLHKTESKFKKLLSDFNFSSIKEITELNNPSNSTNLSREMRLPRGM